MPQTYTPIATVNLAGFSGANGNYFQFDNIPQTYTDLVISINAGLDLGTSYDVVLRNNGDSGSNYSHTWLRGNGSAIASQRYTGTLFYLDYNAGTTMGINRSYLVNVMNYSNSTTYKTFLFRANVPDNIVEQHVGTWRSTAPITSIRLTTNGGGISAGSTATIYGIKAA
jgi:hypothetical protein